MGGFGVLVLLLNIPICIRAISALVNPLAADPSGTRFAGRYRRWEIRPVTGRIAGANTHTTTTTRTTYTESQYGSGYDKHVNTSTSVHNTLLLVDAAGQQHSFTVTDFGVEVWENQIVSVCWAVRGNKSLIFAVLNHSTRRHWVKRWHCLDKVAVPRVGFATFWAIVSCITLIGIIPALVWAVGLRRQLRRFINKGIGPVWTSTGAAAAAMAAVAS